MGVDISVKLASQDQFHELIRLGGAYYPLGHHMLTPQYLNWLYLENPSGPAVLVKAHEDGELIGLIALIPVSLADGVDRRVDAFLQ